MASDAASSVAEKVPMAEETTGRPRSPLAAPLPISSAELTPGTRLMVALGRCDPGRDSCCWLVHGCACSRMLVLGLVLLRT
jgi:hypothetical protein